MKSVKRAYIEGLVVLHNLGVALDSARTLPPGLGFPVGADPLEWVVAELERAQRKICGHVHFRERALEGEEETTP